MILILLVNLKSTTNTFEVHYLFLALLIVVNPLLRH